MPHDVPAFDHSPDDPFGHPSDQPAGYGHELAPAARASASPPVDVPVLVGGAGAEVAAGLLAHGGLVGLPTETVYGLAARADDPDAVARVFAVKGRPCDHPVIVHVSSTAALAPDEGWAVDVPEYAMALVEAVWPGPLTVIVPRGPRSGHHVTGGQETVGLRCPDHPLALAVLEAMGRAGGRSAGLAAPSANRFGRVSPTRAHDVLADLGAHLDASRDAVLDGGPCRVGVESTIVACLDDAPVILRPGEVDAARVAELTGRAVRDVDGTLIGAGPDGEAVRAPGTLTSHYAPRAKVVLVAADSVERAVGQAATALPALRGTTHGGVGLLAPAAVPTPASAVRLAAPASAGEYAQVLYGALREADAAGLACVVAVVPDGDGVALAVRDRLRRAAAGS